MFDEAFDRAPLPQAILDRHGRIAHANAQFRRLFGTSAGLVIDDLLASASPGLLRLVTTLLSERHAFDVKDLVLRLDGGRQMSVEAYGTPLSDDCVLVALVDFTERVTQATSRAQRERSETIARFAGGLAHDLNNLLAAIVATAQAGCGDAEEHIGDASSDFTAIIEEAERGASLARSLRAIAFDETGSWRPVNIAAEVRAAAAVLSRGSSAVPIMLDVAEDTPDVVGDRARLHQLVLNLLVNACDATRLHAGGVEVSLGSTTAGGVELVVADHGPGVPPELRERIFQPYFSTKRHPGDQDSGPGWGTGLGLAIVDAVARATGADVSVGDRQGGGAEFRVRWPATAVVRDQVPIPRDLHGDVSPALVLLADNEVALVGAVARQLRRLGHSVYAAMSAAECRRLFDQYRDSIDVAVLDVKLGDGDGRELAEQFRGQRPDLGIVLMSASRTVLASGDASTRSIVKPFDVRELTMAIDRARADAREARPI
jgi:signal transduction histidine kinase/ActR/RegA family two-component response regulator